MAPFIPFCSPFGAGFFFEGFLAMCQDALWNQMGNRPHLHGVLKVRNMESSVDEAGHCDAQLWTTIGIKMVSNWRYKRCSGNRTPNYVEKGASLKIWRSSKSDKLLISAPFFFLLESPKQKVPRSREYFLDKSFLKKLKENKDKTPNWKEKLFEKKCFIKLYKNPTGDTSDVFCHIPYSLPHKNYHQLGFLPVFLEEISLAY